MRVRARRLNRATLRYIRQNRFFASASNALGVPVAAGRHYPPFGLLPSPMLASAAVSLSSVSVIANALRPRSAALDTAPERGATWAVPVRAVARPARSG